MRKADIVEIMKERRKQHNSDEHYNKLSILYSMALDNYMCIVHTVCININYYVM